MNLITFITFILVGLNATDCSHHPVSVELSTDSPQEAILLTFISGAANLFDRHQNKFVGPWADTQDAVLSLVVKTVGSLPRASFQSGDLTEIGRVETDRSFEQFDEQEFAFKLSFMLNHVAANHRFGGLKGYVGFLKKVQCRLAVVGEMPFVLNPLFADYHSLASIKHILTNKTIPTATIIDIIDILEMEENIDLAEQSAWIDSLISHSYDPEKCWLRVAAMQSHPYHDHSEAIWITVTYARFIDNLLPIGIQERLARLLMEGLKGDEVEIDESFEVSDHMVALIYSVLKSEKADQSVFDKVSHKLIESGFTPDYLASLMSGTVEK